MNDGEKRYSMKIPLVSSPSLRENGKHAIVSSGGPICMAMVFGSLARHRSEDQGGGYGVDPRRQTAYAY